MAEQENEVEIAKEDKKVHASKMKKGRKTIAYLQHLPPDYSRRACRNAG
jgi:hypothetical protein